MLVTLDKLLDYMGGVKLTDKQQTITSEVILPGIQQELEEHLNRPVEVVYVREQLIPNEFGYIVFTVAPVKRINFIADPGGNLLTLPPAPPALPPFSPPHGVERALDLTSNINESFQFYVGGVTTGWDNWNSPTLFPPYSGDANVIPTYTADYLGGYDGIYDEGLMTAICRVAAREVERQFDDTQSLRSGQQDASEDSDRRDKFWTSEELERWGRLRRRVVV